MAREMYMRMLEHIQGRHAFTDSALSDTKFSIYTKCAHPMPLTNGGVAFLDVNNAKHIKALRKLSGILTAGKRMEDIESVSPVYATSEIESANALHMLYANKSLFFSEQGFEMRSCLSIIHWNNLKLDEHFHKIREVDGTKKRYCKTKKQVVEKKLKTPPCNMWRIELKWKAREIRAQMENAPHVAKGLLSTEESSDDEDVLDVRSENIITQFTHYKLLTDLLSSLEYVVPFRYVLFSS